MLGSLVSGVRSGSWRVSQPVDLAGMERCFESFAEEKTRCLVMLDVQLLEDESIVIL
ncbi:MAG: hypothetical protein ACPGLY_13085 [Rubripirellula sp.]